MGVQANIPAVGVVFLERFWRRMPVHFVLFAAPCEGGEEVKKTRPPEACARLLDLRFECEYAR